MPQPHTRVESVRVRPRANGHDLHHTIVGIVAAVLDISPNEVSDDSTLLELGAESLMFVEIVLELENTYGIHIDRSYALPNAHTIDDYISVVHAGLAQKGVES